MKRFIKLPYLLTGIIILCQVLACTAPDEKSRLCITEQEKLENNKKMVVEFYQQLFGDKDLSALDRYMAEDYIQHNPIAPDGREALRGLLAPRFENAPKDSVDIHRVAADGDLVWLHIKRELGGKAVAIVDIFRIEDGKIAEHWDVIQEIPEESANDHPMF